MTAFEQSTEIQKANQKSKRYRRKTKEEKESRIIMIYQKRDNVQLSDPALQGVQEVMDWAASHDLESLEKGTHEIDGDRLFVNIIEYTTTAPENRFWEAHRDYLDVHVPIKGTEQIDLNFISDMEQEPYQPEGDFLPLQGDKSASITMQPGSFLVCFPEDAHRTAVAVNEPEAVKKAVFKVKI